MLDATTPPLQQLHDWTQKFSLKERSELATLTVSNIWLDCPDGLFGDELLTAWFDRLHTLPNRTMVGQIIAFCAAVDFFALRDRGTPEGWDHLVNVNECVRDALLDKGHDLLFVQPLTDALQEIPLRKKRWLLQTDGWRTLRRGVLSNDSLRSWLTATDRSWLLVSVK